MSESTNNPAQAALPLIEWPSAHGFADTLSRLANALEAAHMKIFARSVKPGQGTSTFHRLTR